MLKVMKHDCPFCGHSLNGTELGIHINDLEGKVATPPEDPQLAALKMEMEVLKSLLPATNQQLPHFGE